ncbi:MAG: glutamate--tRNA ligase family protein, partial [Gaiellaceae bacterium]
PVFQSERADRHRKAAGALPGAAADADGALRFGRTTLLRADGSPTYQLASAVDDADFRITHVIRGADHRENTELQRELIQALGAEPPEFVHHGLILGEDGKKLSKRAHGSATIADLREAGIPAEAVRAYLDELGLPRHDVHRDLARVRRLAIEAIAALTDEELAARVGAPAELVPALRGARDLNEARDFARAVLEPGPVHLPPEAGPTLARFRELREGSNGSLGADEARAIVRELKAVGGDLHALRLALTGRERGPELWAVVAALPRDETLRRIDAAL